MIAVAGWSTRSLVGRCALMAGRVMTVGALATAVVGSVSAPAQARSVQGAAAISFLNEQRAANGIAPVTDNQQFASAWCPNEDHGPSGGESGRDFSPITTSWTWNSSPWTDAPLHQQDLYDPAYTQAGDVNVKGQACLGAGAPAPQPASPTYAYFTSEAGHDATAYTETVPGELPYAPNAAVGLRVGKPTGPNIILYANGFPSEYEPSTGMQLSAWTLQTASGAVVPNVRKLDYGTAAAFGYLGSINSDTAILIPPVLQPNTQYIGTVTWLGPTGQTGTQTFTFKTVPAPGHVKVLTRGTVPLSHGIVKVKMACLGGPACKGQAALDSMGFVLAEKTMTLRGNRTTTIAFRISRTRLARYAPSPAPAVAGFISAAAPGPNPPTVATRVLHIRY